jgi:hypothetical protein
MQNSIMVLVVEDEPLIHDLLGEALVDGGFTVAQASTASDALGMIEAPNADYRALVTDINLNPGHKTGWDIAKRAREINADLAVMPTCGDEPIEGWFKAVNPVLYPAEAARRTPVPAPGCPTFGEESVLDRGPKGKSSSWGSVRPGLHVSEQGGLPFTWWDPATLKLQTEELAPLRHQRLLELDPGEAAAIDGVRKHDAWQAQRRTTLDAASIPTLRARTATSWVQEAGLGEPGVEPVEVQVVERDGADRPGGRRFGTFVHTLLAVIGFRLVTDIRSSP